MYFTVFALFKDRYCYPTVILLFYVINFLSLHKYLIVVRFYVEINQRTLQMHCWCCCIQCVYNSYALCTMKIVCADVYMCHSTSTSGYVTFCEKSVVNFFVMGEKISLQKCFDFKNYTIGFLSLRSIQNCLCNLLWINATYFLSRLKFWKKLASIYRLDKKVCVGRMTFFFENTSVPANPLSHHPLRLLSKRVKH